MPPPAYCHTRLTRLALFSLPGDGGSVAVDLFKIETPFAYSDKVIGQFCVLLKI